MTEKISPSRWQTLYEEVHRLSRHEFAYFSSREKLETFSPGLPYLLGLPASLIATQSLIDLFYEFIGLDETIDLIQQGESEPLVIDKTARIFTDGQSGYLTMTLAAYESGLLILVEDVSIQTEHEQNLLQQRNELKLLAEQLTQAKTQLQEMFSRFVPASVAAEALANPQMVQPGGGKREVSVLFADIRGFTAFSEMRDPSLVLNVLNRHFGIVGRIINAYGGTISQYAGDMVMALFNAPDEQPDHAFRAVQAALEIQKGLRHLSDEETEAVMPQVEFGVGVNTGTAVVGYLGFRDRLDYTAIGEAINVGSRLSASAHAGEVLFGPQTYMALRGRIKTRIVGPLRLKGKIVPVMVYEARPGE